MERISVTKKEIIFYSYLSNDDLNSIVSSINEDIKNMSDEEYKNIDLLKMQFYYYNKILFKNSGGRG